MLSTIFTVLILSTTILAQDCSRQYTVQSGDVCDAISAAQGSSTYQLAYSNQDTINECCTNLQIGQVVCLAVTSQPDCTQTYVVGASDTCASIAQQYNTNVTMIGINNPQLDESCDIYPGQVLCVANSPMASQPPEGSLWIPPQPCTGDTPSPSVYTPLQSGSNANSGSGVSQSGSAWSQGAGTGSSTTTGNSGTGGNTNDDDDCDDDDDDDDGDDGDGDGDGDGDESGSESEGEDCEDDD